AAQNDKPKVTRTESVKNVLLEITKNRLGAAAVVDKNKVVGIITDGDIRRMIENFDSIGDLVADNIMGRNPIHIQKDELAVEALNLMRKNNITQIIVLDKEDYLGIVHLHDLLKEGII